MSSMVPDRLFVRLRALRHKSAVRLLSGVAPYYIVNEFPKCGGTWLAQMLSAATGLPFRRNQSVRLEPSITHGHFLNPAGLRNVVVLWRDPRDMLVSFYYHCFFVKEFGNELMIRLMREKAGFADYEDVRANMPAFIRLLATDPVSPRFTWPQFAATWINRPGTVQARYENLRADAAGELSRIAEELTGKPLLLERAQAIAAEFEFAKVKAKVDEKRAMHGDDGISFVREGAVGGWSKHFSPEAVEALAAGGYLEPMQHLGYDAAVKD